MKSMTGYGKGRAEIGGMSLTIELKSVNGRFLEINSRLGKMFACAEDALKRLIAEKVKRGNVEVLYQFEDDPGKGAELKINAAAAESFYRAGKELSEKVGVKNDVTASFLLKQPEVLYAAPRASDEEKLAALVSAAAEDAVINLNAMREREGENLKSELARLGNALSELHGKIGALEPECKAAQKERLKARINEALKNLGANFDEGRFITEAAYLCDKTDITEEVTRLASHLKQYFKLLDGEDAGKKLEFLTQELGREINTVSSKSQDLRLTAYALEFKNELEKVKEQIRNVE